MRAKITARQSRLTVSVAQRTVPIWFRSRKKQITCAQRVLRQLFPAQVHGHGRVKAFMAVHLHRSARPAGQLTVHVGLPMILH